MLQFFKPTSALPDYSVLACDIHSHVLPGIDDGAPDLASALELVRGLRDLGFRQIFTTPHVMSDLYPNSRTLILRKRDELREALEEWGEGSVALDAAAEYFIDENFERLLKNELLLTLPDNHVLVEMSFHQAYPALHRVLFDLQMKGYRPILAHPERYPYYRSAEDFERLKALGCVFQLNLLSLTGYYGKSVQASAKTLLKCGCADFLASDLHHARHLESLQKALSHETVVAALTKNRFRNEQFTQN